MAQILKITVGLAMAIASTSMAFADFPDRAIKMVIPLAAGGVGDISGRGLAEGISKQLGVPMVVENKTGGGGALGSSAVKTSKPDGYTVLSTSSAIAVDQVMTAQPKLKVLDDFEVVGIPLEAQMGIFVNPRLGIKTLKDLIEYTKANPGKLRYGSGGMGTSTHLEFERFKHATKIDIIHIPYKGPDAVAGAVSGEVDVLLFDSVLVKPQVDAGKLYVLGTGGQEPSAFYNNVPTIAQSANLPGFTSTYWIGVFLPKGTNSNIVSKYRAALEATLNDEEVSAKLTRIGFKIRKNSTADSEEKIRGELADWGAVVKEANIQKR